MNHSNDIILEISKIFKLLGDETRTRILLLLKNKQELNVTAISEMINLEQSAISHQLKVLKQNHLVKSRKEGKMVYYSLDDSHVFKLLSMTEDHILHLHKNSYKK